MHGISGTHCARRSPGRAAAPGVGAVRRPHVSASRSTGAFSSLSHRPRRRTSRKNGSCYTNIGCTRTIFACWQRRQRLASPVCSLVGWMAVFACTQQLQGCLRLASRPIRSGPRSASLQRSACCSTRHARPLRSGRWERTRSLKPGVLSSCGRRASTIFAAHASQRVTFGSFCGRQGLSQATEGWSCLVRR